MKPLPARRTVAWLVLLAHLASPHGVGAAPVADGSAPAAQRPTVTTVNAMPVVHIAAPDSGGLSHNKYQSFNVPVQGTVLNNATAATTSTLAGMLAANPNLAGGSAARVILNEVTSNQPSSLLGRLEVAGSPAKVIVANPNGITCSGCGFINTPHVQLTTGRPAASGGALRFDVTDGTVTVGAGGLVGLAARLDLIARQVLVQGPVTSSAQFNAVAGRAYVDADSLALADEGRYGAPDGGLAGDHWTIDIGQSVSAASIKLVATRGGDLGVRTFAPLAAVDDVIVSATGFVQLGPIQAGRDVHASNVGGGELVLGPMLAQGTVQLLSDRITVPAGVTVEAKTGDVHVGVVGDNSDAWGEFRNHGTLKSGNDVVFSIRAHGTFVNRGTLEARRDVVLGADPQALSLPGDWDAYLDTGPRRGAGFDVLPAARGLPGARLNYLGRRYASDEPDSSNGLNPSNGLIHFYPYAALDNGDGGRIAAGHDIDLHYARNSGGSIEAVNDVRIWSVAEGALAGADAAPGRLAAGRDLWVHDLPRYCRDILLCGFSAPPIALSTDRLTAGRDVRFVLTGQADDSSEDFTNSFQIAAARDLRIETDAGFTNQGSLTAGRDLDIHAARITNTAGVDTQSRVYAHERYPGCRTDHGGSCRAEEETWRLPALLSAGGDLTLAAARVENLGATILAGNDLAVSTADFTNERRELAASWRAEYFVQDPPRWQTDTIGGSGGGAMESGGAGLSGATYTRHTALGRTTIGEVASLIQAGGRFSVAGRPQGGSPGAASAEGSGALPVAPPAERFANTQSIIAGAVSISAGEIRNGIGFAEVDRRAEPPRLASASIDLSQLSGPAFAAPAGAADVSGAALAALLPAAQRSPLPFALSAAEEEAALRSALLQATGRALLAPGLGTDDGLTLESRQRAWLAANAAAFALESGAILGEPLTEAQRARLAAPLLWYVAREGRLAPVLYLPEPWRTAAARVDGGLIEGTLGIALSARTIDNTGFIRTDGLLDLQAAELANRKRNATLPETRIPVDGGAIRIWGDTVQPGGFMQAAAWQLAVERVASRSGEFVVSAATAADTAAHSADFEQALREALGEAFVFEAAQNHVYQEFVPAKRKKKRGLAAVAAVAAIVVAAFVAPAVSAAVGQAAGATAGSGSFWAAGTASASAGIGNAFVSQAVASTLGSAVSQALATGRVSGAQALKSGLAGGLTAGVQTWTGSLAAEGALSASAKWVIDRLAVAAAGPLTGTSFGQAFAGSLTHSAAASGAGAIGAGAFGPQGSIGHTLAHGALAALVARARGEDAAAAALGAMSEALLTPTVAGALGPDTDPRLLGAAVRLIGALTAEAAGRDGVAGLAAAGNAFENNYLKHHQIAAKLKELDQCKSAASPGACAAEVERRYTALSRKNTDRLTGCGTAQECRAALVELDADRAQMQARRHDLELRLATLDAAERREYQLLNDNLDNALGGRVTIAATEERLLQRFAQVVGPENFTREEAERMLRSALMTGGATAGTAALAWSRATARAPSAETPGGGSRPALIGVDGELAGQYGSRISLQKASTQELLRMENEAGAHYLARHGDHVTLQELEIRATTGRAPDGTQAPFPQTATRWLNNDDMLEAMRMAQQKLKAGEFESLKDGSREIEVIFPRTIGDGVKRNQTAQTGYFQTDKAVVRFPADSDKPYTAYPVAGGAQ